MILLQKLPSRNKNLKFQMHFLRIYLKVKGRQEYNKQKIKAEFDLEIWEKWFSGLEVFSIKDSKIIISAPNKFVRDWIIRELSDDIKGVVHSLYPDLRTVSFSCS